MMSSLEKKHAVLSKHTTSEQRCMDVVFFCFDVVSTSIQCHSNIMCRHNFLESFVNILREQDVLFQDHTFKNWYFEYFPLRMLLDIYLHIYLLPEWEGKVRYKQNKGFLLTENVRKRFILASIAGSNIIVTASKLLFTTKVLKNA